MPRCHRLGSSLDLVLRRDMPAAPKFIEFGTEIKVHRPACALLKCAVNDEPAFVTFDPDHVTTNEGIRADDFAGHPENISRPGAQPIRSCLADRARPCRDLGERWQ